MPICQAKSESVLSVPTSENTDTLFFDDVITALQAASPEGGSVCAIGTFDTDFILRAGYHVTDGECDVCIACGGENEFALARRTTHKKLILVPAFAHYACACAIFRTEAQAFAQLSSGEKPFAAVFDAKTAHDNHAALFGEIVSLDLAAFDARFAARMNGQRPNRDVEAEIAELIAELTAQLCSVEKDRSAQKIALTHAGKSAAKIIADNPMLLHISGTAQAAEAYRMLCAAEKRPVCMRGETEMIFSAYISELYIKSLTQHSFDFPPDNNKRIDCLCEYLGADVRRACISVAQIFAPQKLKLYEYRVKEFRAEFMRALADIAGRRAAAMQVFKRLYPDDGYCLTALVDKTDVPLCIALAPDVFNADSMLAFLKQAGKLEKYVV